MALAIATPMAMIAPMNDWMFERRAGDQQHQHHAGHHRGRRRDGDQRQPQRLEIGRQQQEDDDHGQHQPDAQPASICRIGAICPRTSTVHALGRLAGRAQRAGA